MSASELLIINSQLYARVILLYCSGRNHFYLTFEQQCRGLQRAVLFFYYTNCISHYKRSEWNCYHPNSSNCRHRLFFRSQSLFLFCIKKLCPVCRSVYFRQSSFFFYLMGWMKYFDMYTEEAEPHFFFLNRRNKGRVLNTCWRRTFSRCLLKTKSCLLIQQVDMEHKTTSAWTLTYNK